MGATQIEIIDVLQWSMEPSLHVEWFQNACHEGHMLEWGTKRVTENMSLSMALLGTCLSPELLCRKALHEKEHHSNLLCGVFIKLAVCGFIADMRPRSNLLLDKF